MPENSKPQPQMIPLSRIHDLPGVFIAKPQDKSLGGLVTSIQSGGVKEAVILRQRNDGEYELLSGYRRRRASELAKKQDIPALVYEMSIDEARKFFHAVKNKPDAPIPGKLVDPNAPKEKAQEPEKAEKKEPVTSGEKAPETPVEEKKPDAPAKAEEKPVKDAAQEKNAKTGEGEKPTENAEKKAEPAAISEEKAKEAEKVSEEKKAAEEKKPSESVQPEGEKKDEKPAENKKPEAPVKEEKKEEKPAPAKPVTVTGPAAKGPAGTAISQVFDERLAPPTEADLKNLPSPKEGESFFIRLHPAYLEKSKFNTFSVDKNSENFKELMKSVELVGIKDPVLARLKPEGGLEILSGQRRHLAAMELNYPVPTIIQKIEDADAKIIVADGNLHRDKISTYDLSRALRMKMEGMKQKAGRKKKGYTADELNSDEKLAREMGMSVSKLNRIIRLSEASKEVCDRVDDGSLTLSVASAISFLKPANQDLVLHLSDLGYKVTNERIERVKKVDSTGKLDEMKMRSILDDKDIAPKVTPPAPTPTANINTGTPSMAPAATDIPKSPDIPKTEGEKTAEAPKSEAPNTPVTPATEPKKEDNPFRGPQERPEVTKVILTGDRLRKYFPDVSMTPREIEESVYEALEERRVRQMKQKEKEAIFKKPSGPVRK